MSSEKKSELSKKELTQRNIGLEKQLSILKSQLNETEQLANLGHWELDITNNVLSWSDEIYRIFNMEPQAFEATYDAFLNAIHPDDRDMVNKAYSDSLTSKSAYIIVHRLLMRIK